MKEKKKLKDREELYSEKLFIARINPTPTNWSIIVCFRMEIVRNNHSLWLIIITNSSEQLKKSTVLESSPLKV